ncbi:MAG: hybrid sensor histidine kinase/response regulator, partial [Pedobacter sp.]
MLYRKLFIVSICFFLSIAVFGQQPQIQFSSIDLSNGLSHNQVNSIFKDAKGFIWFGTLSGLNRYDGYQFKVFKHDPRDTTSISDDNILNIFELPDHKLYLETMSGPNVYDPEKQIFIRNAKAYLNGLGIAATLISDILKDTEGNFWFNAGPEGIFKYDIKSSVSIHLKPGAGEARSSITRTAVSSLQKDEKGNVWVIHRDKTIERLDKHTGKVNKRITALQLKKASDFQNFKLFVDYDGDFWIYTLNNQQGIDFYA